jgi:hypothetical protein
MKYKYKWLIYTNNLCYGYMKLNEYSTKSDAENAYYNFYMNKYGACDIVKKRVYYRED